MLPSASLPTAKGELYVSTEIRPCSHSHRSQDAKAVGHTVKPHGMAALQRSTWRRPREGQHFLDKHLDQVTPLGKRAEAAGHNPLPNLQVTRAYGKPPLRGYTVRV